MRTPVFDFGRFGVLSILEASKLIGVSKSTIQRHMAAGHTGQEVAEVYSPAVIGITFEEMAPFSGPAALTYSRLGHWVDRRTSERGRLWRTIRKNPTQYWEELEKNNGR